MAASIVDSQQHAIVRETVLDLLDTMRPASTADGVDYLRRWVRRHVALINEPIENFTAPYRLLEAIQHGPPWPWGDCDDAAGVAAALYLAAGLPVRLTAVAPPALSQFVHVFPEVWSETDQVWLVADPTSDLLPPATWKRFSLEV